MGVWWCKIEKVLSKEIPQLEDGDHIYTWRPDNSKSHGIYVGDGEVIRLADQGLPKKKKCGNKEKNLADQNSSKERKKSKKKKTNLVVSKLNDFRDGGKVYLFEYGVNPVLFLAKPQAGATCTLFTDGPKIVKSRATYFRDNPHVASELFGKNSEDFAVFCKTGLLSTHVSRSEQAAASLLAIICAVSFLYLFTRFAPASLAGWAATGVVVYCTFRLASDIGARPHVIANELPQVDSVISEKISTQVDFLPTLKAYVASIVLVLSIWVYLLFAVPEYITLLCWAIFQEGFNFGKRELSNKISVDKLREGDHIYTWRGYTYSHHGIYVGEGKVIHAVRGRGPFIHSSSRFRSSDKSVDHSSSSSLSSDKNVESVDIGDFACGGELYRYKYRVGLGYFLAKIRGGACTLVSIDKNAVSRAKLLLDYNSSGEAGAYDLIRNNCEDFAIYCRTGLAVRSSLGRSGQIAGLIASSGFGIPFTFRYMTSNLIRLVAGFCLYSTVRMMCDTKYRLGTRRIPVGQLADSEIPVELQSSSSRIIQALKPVEVCIIILWTLWCIDYCFF